MTKLVYTRIPFSASATKPVWALSVGRGNDVVALEDARIPGKSHWLGIGTCWGAPQTNHVKPQPEPPEHIERVAMMIALLGVSPLDIRNFPAIVKILKDKA